MWFAFLSLAFARPEPPRPVPPHVETARSAIDWKAAGDEAVQVLSDYLQVDTINPPGNEARGVAFFGGILDEAGIGWKEVTHAPGRSSIIARLDAGTDTPPLCLLSHLDVVTSEREHWARDPMGGQVVDGEIWGRGALDMKGMGALQLMTMVWLARNEVPLSRDVVLIAVADEEVDNTGMQQIVAEHWDDIGCSHLINEGGIGVKDALFEGQNLHAISVAEKGILWLKVHADGVAGHGSTQVDGEAPTRLLEAMKAIDRYKPKPVVDPALRVMLKNIGRHKGGMVRTAMTTRPLFNSVVKPKLMANASTRAALTDTIHLTGALGAQQPNVVPSRVSAQYDCRLIRGTTPEAHLARIEKLIRKVEGVSIEVLSQYEANASPMDDPLYDTIAAYAVEGDPNAVAGPVLSVGFTDSLYVRPLGVHAYGYVPFVVTQAEAETMHGHNERVSVENVHDGLRRLFSIVVDFAGA